ncbi:VOC family protein [Jannaschia sp. R86511]|uniref:VOC family protein n=1 Tax=Jannaschia sp. R86511 TaxID=3093853 RepID=UPI0036D39D6B
MKLTYLYLPVTDLGAAVAFYRDQLGLQEVWREGETTVAFAAADGSVELMVDTEDYPPGPMYLVDDVLAWREAHAGVPVRVPRYDIPGGTVEGYEDPAGNVFYVFDLAEA